MFYPRLFGVPSMRPQHPSEELNRLRGEMDRIMDALGGRGAAVPGANVYPALNVTEDANNYYVRAELPGMQAGDLEIQITDGNLSISGERKLDREGENTRYHRREREGGHFSRALSLPRDVDAEAARARMKNGMLTLVLPKAESAKPRKITIGN
jgi:HSP20 family protein